MDAETNHAQTQVMYAQPMDTHLTDNIAQTIGTHPPWKRIEIVDTQSPTMRTRVNIVSSKPQNEQGTTSTIPNHAPKHKPWADT